MAIIKSENWDGVTAPAIPAGWTLDSVLVTDTTNGPSSPPNSLVYPVASLNAGLVPNATWATADTNGGDVQVSGTFRFSSTNTHDQDAWLYARASAVATSATWGSTTLYYAGIVHNAAPHIFLNKRISGTDTQLGSSIAIPSWVDGTNYRLFLQCQGTTIRVKLQRLSDGLWLDSTGTWVTDVTGQTWAISVTDSAVSGAGYAGTGFYYAAGAPGTVGVDDWLLETAGGTAAISATPARLQAGAGAQTVTIQGTGTAFSTSSSTQFTLSGGSGASLVSQSASSGTAATLSIDPGTAPGTLTITDTTDGSVTAQLTVYGTFYVASTGSDANSGLDPAHPWQTIAHVNAQTLTPGCQVLFAAGQSFSGSLVVGQSGTAAAPIVLSSYGTGAATIHPGTGTGILLADVEHVHVRTLAVTGPGVTVSGRTSSTTSAGYGVDVRNTATQASISAYKEGIVLDGLTVSGCYAGILLRSYAGAAGGPYPVGYNGAQITNCTVHDCLGVAGIYVWATTPALGLYAQVTNGPANTPYHKNIYIGGCTCYNIYGDSATTANWSGAGIVMAATLNGLIERCCAYNNGQANGLSGGGPFAIWLYEAVGCVIQFCEAHHQHDPSQGDGGAFDFDGGTQNCLIQSCYSHDCAGTAIAAGTFPGSHPTSGNVFRYNISQNDGRINQAACVREWAGDTTLTVHNCTFYSGSPGTGGAFSSGYLVEQTSADFYNNIFWCGPGTALGNPTAGRFAGNLYWFGGASFSIIYGGTTYSTLSAFAAVQENAGGAPRGQVADPQLAAAGSGGAVMPAQPAGTLSAYDLAASSPARDAGLDLRALFDHDPGPLDFHGHPGRAGSGYDIGACEYGAAALLGAAGALRRVSLGGGIGG